MTKLRHLRIFHPAEELSAELMLLTGLHTLVFNESEEFSMSLPIQTPPFLLTSFIIPIPDYKVFDAALSMNWLRELCIPVVKELPGNWSLVSNTVLARLASWPNLRGLSISPEVWPSKENKIKNKK